MRRYRPTRRKPRYRCEYCVQLPIGDDEYILTGSSDSLEEVEIGNIVTRSISPGNSEVMTYETFRLEYAVQHSMTIDKAESEITAAMLEALESEAIEDYDDAAACHGDYLYDCAKDDALTGRL